MATKHLLLALMKVAATPRHPTTAHRALKAAKVVNANADAAVADEIAASVALTTRHLQRKVRLTT